MVTYGGRPRPQPDDDISEARRRWVTKLAHKRGGVTKAVSTLISLVSKPRDAAIMKLLCNRYPPKAQATIVACRATIFGRAQDSPSTLRGAIREVEETLFPKDVRAVIKKVALQSTPCLSGMRFSPFQNALSDELADRI